MKHLLPLSLALCAFFATLSVSAQGRHAGGLASEPLPSGPVVLIDTTLGRMTCTLYSKQAPNTSANFVGLASGSKDWTDNATHTVQHGRPFYDGAAFFGISDAALVGDRLGGNTGLAGDPFPSEQSGLGYDRPGRLVMARSMAGSPNGSPNGSPDGKGGAMQNSSSLFFLSAYADDELAGRGGTVFGQCDDASLPIIRALTHALLSTENHPQPLLAVNHIKVLKAGETIPPVAADVAPSSITPQPGPPAMAALPSPDPTGPTAIFDLTVRGKEMGRLSCRLFQDEAPVGTRNFLGLVNGTKEWRSPATHQLMHGKRFYDGLSFGRDIPDFMIQNADLPGDPKGGGDLGFHFANEIVPGLTFDRPGRLAYANAGPDTNQSEFFVTEHAVHRLDGNFTIFGQCDDASVKLVEAIARMPRDAHNKPLMPVVIKTVTIVPAR